MKMKLFLPIVALLVSSLQAEFEIRDASHHPVEGFTESSYTSDGIKRKVYLDSDMLVSSKDVKDAFLSSRLGDTYSVHIEFTNEGSEKLKQITEKRIGKEVAIIIDGEVLSAPTIMAALSRKAQITGLSKSKAGDLVEKILNHNKSELSISFAPSSLTP